MAQNNRLEIIEIVRFSVVVAAPTFWKLLPKKTKAVRHPSLDA
jgi:hypothetical protein